MRGLGHGRHVVIGVVASVLAAGLAGCSSGLTDQHPSPTVSSASSSPVALATAPPSDGGPIEHASGTAEPGEGATYWYTVAADDTLVAIAARFQLCTADVFRANDDQDAFGKGISPGQKLVIERVPGSTGHEAGECDDPNPPN
jgi:LysM repeat protein